MTIPLMVYQCGHCAARYFPGRSLCAACGSANFVEVDGSHGVIEQWTVLRKRPGENAADQPVGHYLATVRTTAGPRVIAAMEEAGETAAAVTLYYENACLTARRIHAAPSC